MPGNTNSDTWNTSWKSGYSPRAFTTQYDASTRSVRARMAQSARSPQPARTYELGTLPPATPRRDELLSAVPKYPTPPGSPAPLKRPSTSSSITPEETAFRRSQALTRPGHVEVGRNGTVVQLNPQGKTGGLMYAPPVPRHELDTPNYHPRRMCELTKFEETKNRTAHDYTAKMRDRRTNAGASLDVRGIDTCYGRKSLHTGFVEAVYAQPYPTSFRSGAGFGYATSR